MHVVVSVLKVSPLTPPRRVLVHSPRAALSMERVMGGGDIVIDSDPPGAASFDVEKIDHLYHSSTILHSSILRAVATAAWRLYSLCVNRTTQYHVADATLC